MWLGEDQTLNFQHFSRLLLDFHVIVVSMVSDPLLLSGYGGGFGFGSSENEMGFDECPVDQIDDWSCGFEVGGI